MLFSQNSFISILPFSMKPHLLITSSTNPKCVRFHTGSKFAAQTFSGCLMAHLIGEIEYLKNFLVLSYPIARKSVVTGNFFFRSMYANMTLCMSVANSIHEPLKGITRAEYNFVPLA